MGDLADYSAGTKLFLSHWKGNGKRLLKIHTLNEYSKAARQILRQQQKAERRNLICVKLFEPALATYLSLHTVKFVCG
jgi:hypothetical protein